VTYRWGWVGAAQPDGFTVAARTGPGAVVRLGVATTTDPVMTWSEPHVADAWGFAKIVVSGLQPATDHVWQVEVDGFPVTPTGQCRTFPAPGAASAFRIGLISCSGVNSSSSNSSANPPALDSLMARRPDLVVHTGDLHYYNPVANDLVEHQRGYEHVFERNPRYNELLRTVPSIYMWSDHDYCGGDHGGNGNSDRTESGRQAACTVYRQVVPHYPLPRPDGPLPDGAVHQRTKIGRIHVVVSDLRSCRDPDPTPHGPEKSMMGADQKAWWKKSMLEAKADGSPIVLWVQETAFHLPRTRDGALGYNTDNWAAFDDERVELSNFLRDQQIPPVVSLQGDLHFSAGKTRIDLSDDRLGVPMMACHVSLLQSNSSMSAGVWDMGPWSDQEGYYGIVDLHDDGVDVTVDFDVFQVDKLSGAEVHKGRISRSFRPTTPPPAPEGVVALRVGDDHLRLRWDPVQDEAVVMYRIYRKGTLVGVVPADTTSLDL